MTSIINDYRRYTCCDYCSNNDGTGRNIECKECHLEVEEKDYVPINFINGTGRNVECKESFDVISHPSHYAEGRKYKPRKVIADWGLNFNLGNALKYLSRAGRKGDKIEDLQKAIKYIEFEIEDCGENKEDV